MLVDKITVPVVAGWFTTDGPPRLTGSRCTTCGSYAFPRASWMCRNPRCEGSQFDEVPLSSRGRVWSFTVNRYQPPPPYVPPTAEFEPFGVVAVELLEEKMVVMGQLVSDAEVAIGDQVELVLDTLYEDDDHRYQVWKWRPAGDEG